MRIKPRQAAWLRLPPHIHTIDFSKHCAKIFQACVFTELVYKVYFTEYFIIKLSGFPCFGQTGWETQKQAFHYILCLVFRKQFLKLFTSCELLVLSMCTFFLLLMRSGKDFSVGQYDKDFTSASYLKSTEGALKCFQSKIHTWHNQQRL